MPCLGARLCLFPAKQDAWHRKFPFMERHCTRHPGRSSGRPSYLVSLVGDAGCPGPSLELQLTQVPGFSARHIGSYSAEQAATLRVLGSC